MRFQRVGDLSDLIQAIKYNKHAAMLSPDEPRHLSSLGSSLYTRYENQGGLDDLTQAIKHQECAVRLTNDIPSKAIYMNNLGIALAERSRRLGVLDDLAQAIKHQEHSVNLTPDYHPDKASRLSNLANSLQTRFHRLGQLGDLEQSIKYKKQAVSITAEEHHIKPGLLNNLGTSFQTRFETLGELDDLAQAIEYKKHAIRLTADQHPDKAVWLNNLGNSLQTRFGRLGDMSDLTQAIEHQEKAVSLTVDEHPAKAGFLSNLAVSLQRKFENYGDLNDLKQAIEHHKHAVGLTPDNHPSKAVYMHNLGNTLQTSFERLGDLNNLTDAINHQAHAVHLTPDNNPYKPQFLINLSRSLLLYVDTPGHPPLLFGDIMFASDVSILEHICSSYIDGATNIYGFPKTRMTAVQGLCKVVLQHELYGRALNTAEITAEIILLVAWRGLSQDSYDETLQKLLSIQSVLAVLCMRAETSHIQQNHAAVNLLEQTRALYWNSILQLRIDTSSLHTEHPKLAADFDICCTKLREHTVVSSIGGPEITSKMDWIDVNIQLALDWDQLLKQIRTETVFKDFLKPVPLTSYICDLPPDPIVIINTHETQCDAFVIWKKAIKHIPLHELTITKITHYVNSWTEGVSSWSSSLISDGELERHYMKPILRRLWVDLVQVILEHLNLLDPKADEVSANLPHVWWCPTGMLSKLPIHAAGPYRKGQLNIYDYVVSSYAITLQSLSKAYKKSIPSVSKALIVSQSAAAGYDNWSVLESASDERENVHVILSSSFPNMQIDCAADGGMAHDEILAKLATCNWFHVASHGFQDLKRPLDSYFAFQGQPLTLREIASINLPQADFAYLSACETATGSADLPDEAMHLAAGLHIAGFRSIVATLS